MSHKLIFHKMLANCLVLHALSYFSKKSRKGFADTGRKINAVFAFDRLYCTREACALL